MAKYPILAALFFSFTAILVAQQNDIDSTIIQIELKDGSILRGRVVVEDSLVIHFMTMGGITVEIPHLQVQWKMKDSSAHIIRESFSGYDPNTTRLFFMPTAKAIGKGSGYFSAYELFFPMVAVGITDRLSVAGGMSLFPSVKNQLLYFAPKLTLHSTEKLSIAAGGLWFGTTSSGIAESGLLYGLITFGNQRLTVTTGLGIPSSRSGNGIVVIGGELKISNSIKLLSENWLFSQTGLMNFGLRFHGERLAADIGLMRPMESMSGDGFPFFPWLGFVYNFGAASIPMQQTEDEIFDAHMNRVLLSYDFPLSRTNDNYQSYLSSYGYRGVDNSSSFFDSPREGSSKGTGIMVRFECEFFDRISFGLLYSTLGSLIGKQPVIMTTAYASSVLYPYSYYYTYGHEYSMKTIGGLLSYCILSNDKANSSLYLGAGLGYTTVDARWRANPGYYSAFDQAREVFSTVRTALSGIGMITVEQRFTESLFLFGSLSYFTIPKISVQSFAFVAGTYTDYSSTPYQTKDIIASFPSHSIDYSHVKLSIGAGVGL